VTANAGILLARCNMADGYEKTTSGLYARPRRLFDTLTETRKTPWCQQPRYHDLCSARMNGRASLSVSRSVARPHRVGAACRVTPTVCLEQTVSRLFPLDCRWIRLAERGNFTERGSALGKKLPTHSPTATLLACSVMCGVDGGESISSSCTL